MKLSGPAAARFCAAPDTGMIGALLHGPDSGLIALRRADLVARLTEGDDMRLTRLDAAEVRRDPVAIDTALRARAFFPGRRVVLIPGAKDALAKPLGDILAGVTPEDAFLVIEAEALVGKSALRRLFEGDKRLAALGLYPQPSGAAELGEWLLAAGLRHGLAEDAMGEVVAAAQELDAGTLDQLVKTIAVFGLDKDRPLDAREIAALLPRTSDSGLDPLIDAVADGRVGEVGPMIGRVWAAGMTPTGVLIAVGRHFRRLLSVASAAGGPEQGLARLRPPVFGPRREALFRQTRRWGAPRLERAIRLLFAAARTLRSPGERPDRAIVERALIRLSMMV